MNARASCWGKRRYTYYGAKGALGAARKGKSRGVDPPKGMYRCPACGHWHLTSMTKKERRSA
jgi:hypothetical protein